MTKSLNKRPPERKLRCVLNGMLCVVTERTFWEKKGEGKNIRVIEILGSEEGK